MIWRGRSPGGQRRAYRLVGCATLALSCVLATPLAAAAVLARSPIAAASGFGGAVTFTPPSGPPGTLVVVTISAEPPSPTPYVLSISPTDPAASACADGLRLDNAPKIIVMPGQPTTTTFFWPTDLSSGAYYLCAGPAGGQTGPIVWSQQPFMVSSGTPTVPAVVAQVPPGGAVTVTVDTSALGGDTPQDFSLTQPGQPGAVPVNWVSETQSGTVYTYTVSIPVDTSPGTYAVRVTTVGGGIAAISNTFQVVAPSGRGGPGGPSVSSHPPISVPGTSATSPTTALLVAAIALLLALAVAGLAAPLLRRQRHGTRSR
ncbi:MAG TPA: hypothetical protein VF116_15415 [Ktedonobacterales bacterium]